MNLGIIDVREWQTMVDFRTGRKAQLLKQNHLINAISHLLRMHPYPGDIDPSSNAWVTDVALDLNSIYHPDFIFLTYAQPFFTSVFQHLNNEEWQAIITSVTNEVNRFIALSGFVPVIVGSGRTTPLQGEIDISSLQGLANCVGMGPTYAGLYYPSKEDLTQLQDDERVEMIIPRHQLIDEWSGNADFTSRLPEYLLSAGQGYTFRGIGNMPRILYSINGKDKQIPVKAPFGAKSITEIAPMIKKILPDHRVALIMVEGIGCEDFPFAYEQCDNTFSWHTYGTGDDQYLALTSGKHLPFHPFPPGHKYYRDDCEDKPYPYSGIYRYMPDNVIGADTSIKSAAVGSRSILTHVASGADISVECFARALYNYGSMAVLNNLLD